MTPDAIYLQRLSRFIDVVYAVIFFHIMSQYLPHFEGGAWMGKPYGLLSHFYDSRVELLRVIIGSGLALLYWNQHVGLFKHLERTNYTHAALSLLQLFFVVLFVYFAITDPNLESKSSPALQAGSLAIAGFMSVGLWKYAAKNGLIREGMSEDEVKQITKGNLMEPLTAVVNIGLAFVGPMVWTLAWFVLPPIFLWILKKRKQ